MDYTVEYIENVIDIPSYAKQTEITTYIWPGFLAEWCYDELTVWELYSPSIWRRRPDIMAPPADCIGITSSQGLHWAQGQERWVGHQHGPLRVLRELPLLSLQGPYKT